MIKKAITSTNSRPDKIIQENQQCLRIHCTKFSAYISKLMFLLLKIFFFTTLFLTLFHTSSFEALITSFYKVTEIESEGKWTKSKRKDEKRDHNLRHSLNVFSGPVNYLKSMENKCSPSIHHQRVSKRTIECLCSVWLILSWPSLTWHFQRWCRAVIRQVINSDIKAKPERYSAYTAALSVKNQLSTSTKACRKSTISATKGTALTSLTKVCLGIYQF